MEPLFMVSWRWLGPDTPEIEALIPAERELIRRWQGEGVVRGRWIATDESRGWLLFAAADEGEVESRLARLPLRNCLDLEITHLAPE